jgi:hypothetical protein
MERALIATIHLAYKMQNPGRSWDSLGFMTIEEFSNRILHDIYPIEEVERSILDLFDNGYIDIYYMVGCPSCNTVNYYKEISFPDVEKFHLLSSEGEKCEGCSHRIVILKDLERLKKRYALSPSLIESIPEEVKEKGSIWNPFKKIFR